MKRAYTIKTTNPTLEYLALKAKMVNNNPLESLGYNNTICFDVEPQLEFIITDDSIIGKINTVLSGFGFNIIIIDVTQELLLNKIDLTNANEETITDIQSFYFDSFDGNDILDKILKVGSDSLTKLDKLILSY